MDVQRQIRFEPHRPSVPWVVEADRHGMKGLTLETNKSVTDLFRRSALFGILVSVPNISANTRFTTSAATIDRISDQGMSDMSHMHPNLVCAPGCQNAFHQRCYRAECSQHAVAGERRFAARYHRHLLPVR